MTPALPRQLALEGDEQAPGAGRPPFGTPVSYGHYFPAILTHCIELSHELIRINRLK